MIMRLYERAPDGTETILASVNSERMELGVVVPVVDVHGNHVDMYNPFGPDPETPESVLCVEVTDL